MSAIKRMLRTKRLALAEKPKHLPTPAEEPLLMIDLGWGPSETMVSLYQLQEDCRLQMAAAFALPAEKLHGDTSRITGGWIEMLLEMARAAIYPGLLPKEIALPATVDEPPKPQR